MQQYQTFENPESGATFEPDLCVPSYPEPNHGLDQEMQPSCFSTEHEEKEPTVEIQVISDEKSAAGKSVQFADPAGDRYDPQSNIE